MRRAPQDPPDLEVPDIQFAFLMAMIDDNAASRAGAPASPVSLSAVVGAQKAAVRFAQERRSACSARGSIRISLVMKLISKHGRGIQDHKKRMWIYTGASRPCKAPTCSAGVETTTAIRKIPARTRRHGLSPGRHLQEGVTMPGSGRSET